MFTVLVSLYLFLHSLVDMNMKVGAGLDSSPSPLTRGLSSLPPGPQIRPPTQGPPTLPPQTAMQALPPRVPPSLPPHAPQLGPPFSLGPTDCSPQAPMTAVPPPLPPSQTALPPMHMQQSAGSILPGPILPSPIPMATKVSLHLK